MWSNLSFAMVDNLIRGSQLSNMIVTTSIIFLKIGSPSHPRRQATGQATRGQMLQSRMSTRREA